MADRRGIALGGLAEVADPPARPAPPPPVEMVAVPVGCRVRVEGLLESVRVFAPSGGTHAVVRHSTGQPIIVLTPPPGFTATWYSRPGCEPAMTAAAPWLELQGPDDTTWQVHWRDPDGVVRGWVRNGRM